jgi:GT2 family glycosyltransferase
MEEIDLCWRFHKAGYRVSFLPDSVVYHIGGGTLSYKSPYKTYLNFRNSLYLLHKNLPEDKFSSILLTRKLLDGVAIVFFIMKGNGKSAIAVWRAHMDYYKALGRLSEKRKIVREMEISQSRDCILNKSIVFEFYIKGNRTYNSLIS